MPKKKSSRIKNTPRPTERDHAVEEVSSSKTVNYLVIFLVIACIVAILRAFWGAGNLEEQSGDTIESCFEQCQASSQAEACLSSCRAQQLERITLPEAE